MDGGVIGGRPHRFTVADHDRMAEAGILGRDARVELIRGRIVDMAAIGTPHDGVVIRLTRVLSALLADRGMLGYRAAAATRRRL
jgi:hypothetical protein